MADANWKEFAASLRQTNAALKAGSAAVQTLGGDEAFQGLLAQLQSLPDAASFSVFDATAQWRVDLAKEQPAATPDSRQPETPFIERIKQPVRRAEGLSTVQEKPLTAGEEDRRERALPKPAETSETGRKNADAQVRVAASAPVGSATDTGAWSVLQRIAKLAEELQPSRNSATGNTSTATARPVPTAGRDQVRATHAARPSVAPADRSGQTTASVPAEPGRSASSPAEATPEAADGFALLTRYVNLLSEGSGRGGSTGSAMAQTGTQPRPSSNSAPTTTARETTSPVPRAPSLLTADRPPAATERISGPGIGSGRAQESETAGETGVTPTVRNEGELFIRKTETAAEDPADRINRALIEQAWLRGGDLT